MTNILILLKILFNKKKEIYVKSIWLMHNSLEVYAFYLGIGKLITSITIKFYVLLYYIYRIRHGIKKELWSKTSVNVISFFKNNYLLMSLKIIGQQINHH